MIKRLNMLQRHNWSMVISLMFASILLIALIYQAIEKYTHVYTIQHWQNHVNTFAKSSKFQLLIGSESGAKDIARSFTNAQVLNATIVNAENHILASVGQSIQCPHLSTHHFESAFFIEASEISCFFAPIYEDSYLGHVELIVSKSNFQILLQQLFVISSGIILLVTAIILIVIFYFSGFFTRALVEIMTVMQGIQQGVRGQRLQFKGNKDFIDLREALNELLAQIELNEQILEQRVYDKTQELKIALDQSQTANVYKGQIMAMITHEMKTPLHALTLYLQTIANMLPVSIDLEFIHQFNDTALKRAKDLNDNINNILLQSRLEADKYELWESEFWFQALVDECIAKVTPLKILNRNSITLSGHDLAITCDRNVVGHILNNLLNNACKFTLDGNIQVSWRREFDNLMIEIRDTGCGIPDDLKAHIFTAFWQADMRLSRKYGGYGLGLSIVKQFIQRLDGTVQVSDNVNQGTIFTLKFPCQKTRKVHPQ